MARIVITLANGDYNTADGSVLVVGEISDKARRQLTFSYSGATPTAGTMSVYVRAHDGAAWELLPSGQVNLANPLSLLFTFVGDAYRFVIADVSGSGYVTAAEYEL